MPCRNVLAVGFVAGLCLVIGASCTGNKGNAPTTGSGSESAIRMTGSDTMVNLAQAWAENYKKVHPEVSVQVAGGGSGVGIAGLIDGFVDIATASRTMKDKEIARAKENHGVEPKEVVVGLDCLAIYVHKDNPLDTISI